MNRRCTAVAIGASTGGPPAIALLLRRLRCPFPAPIFIAQHIEPGFGAGMVEWLRGTGHDVVTLAAPEQPRAGRVYLARDGAHLGLLSADLVGAPSAAAADYCPSVDVLFRSVARYAGAGAVGVLLTGMGKDGAAGLAALRAAGGITLAQDPASCVVDGMPGAAIDAGAVQIVAGVAAIADLLNDLNGTVAPATEQQG